MPHPKILIYGPEGTGKTAFACTFPGKKLLLNVDVTPDSTRYARSRKRDPERLIIEPKVPRYAPGMGLQVKGLMDQIERLMWREDPGVAAVITDPIHELYRRLLEEVSNKSTNPTWDHRGTVTEYIVRYCTSLCEIPTVSAIFVAHELEVKDEIEGGLVGLPFTGTSNFNLSKKIRGMVDIVAYTERVQAEDGTVQYGAHLIHQKGRKGKVRYACLGTYQPLDLALWMKLLQEAEEEVDDEEVSTSTQEEAAQAA